MAYPDLVLERGIVESEHLESALDLQAALTESLGWNVDIGDILLVQAHITGTDHEEILAALRYDTDELGLLDDTGAVTRRDLKMDMLGQAAIRLGFAKPRDVIDALAEQADRRRGGEPTRPLGRVLVEMGVLTEEELAKCVAAHMEWGGGENRTRGRFSRLDEFLWEVVTRELGVPDDDVSYSLDWLVEISQYLSQRISLGQALLIRWNLTIPQYVEVRDRFRAEIGKEYHGRGLPEIAVALGFAESYDVSRALRKREKRLTRTGQAPELEEILLKHKILSEEEIAECMHLRGGPVSGSVDLDRRRLVIATALAVAVFGGALAAWFLTR